MGATAELQVGERAYAVGAPEGLSLTLSDGLISSLREAPGGMLIQTSAPISHGSSGGGLFDSRGRLIGITSFYIKGGDQLNFARPVEWIKALPRHGETAKELAKQSSNVAAQLAKAAQAMGAGYYATAFSLYKPLAERGNARAQNQLGIMYNEGDGTPRNYTKAVYRYRKAAKQGNGYAQANLGGLYVAGHGVSKDYTMAFYWYGKAAAQGYAYPQAYLASMYEDGHGVPQNYAKAAYWYHKAAEQGYAAAQNNLGGMYDELLSNVVFCVTIRRLVF